MSATGCEQCRPDRVEDGPCTGTPNKNHGREEPSQSCLDRHPGREEPCQSCLDSEQRCLELEERLERAERLLRRLMPAPVVSDLLASEETSCPTRSSHHKLTKKLMASEETPCPRRSSKHKLTKRALVRHEHSEAQFWKRETDVDSQQLGLSKSVHYDNVTVFFSDIAGFTAMSQSVKPELVMAFLHSLYSSFDDLLEDHPTLWKVETIGDSYMVAGGLLQFPEKPNTPEEVAHDVVEFAKQALEITGNMTMPNGEACALRVGIHSGPVCTGVVGSKMPRYCLFGDTVNTASRMESTGRAGALQISESTWQLLGDQESSNWHNEEVVAKGKGVMRTHVLALPLPHPGTSEEQKMEKPQSPLAGGQTS